MIDTPTPFTGVAPEIIAKIKIGTAMGATGGQTKKPGPGNHRGRINFNKIRFAEKTPHLGVALIQIQAVEIMIGDDTGATGQ